MSDSNLGLSHVDQLRSALLRLHKTLLDDERVSYERVYGRIATNGEFLQLVLGHAWFAWLRPLSQLIAQLNRSEVEGKSPSVEITAFIASVSTVWMTPARGNRSGRHYYDALQRSAEVVLAHAAVRALFPVTIVQQEVTQANTHLGHVVFLCENLEPGRAFLFSFAEYPVVYCMGDVTGRPAERRRSYQGRPWS